MEEIHQKQREAEENEFDKIDLDETVCEIERKNVREEHNKKSQEELSKLKKQLADFLRQLSIVISSFPS